MHIQELYQLYLQHPFIQTDTRKLRAGELFFALKGDNFNGNSFAEKALELDAAAVIVDEPVNSTNKKIIRVENVLSTLQQLAKYHRQQFRIPFIAITGSNGKTTTKELIHAVLSSQYKTYTTEGNLNNHIGVPLTILKIKQDADMAVIEMGANHQKEIASYCTYTLPNFGLINNCGKAHLEGFGGIEGVRKGKGELYDFIRENGGSVFINTDLDYLQEMSKGITDKITYGTSNAATTGRLVASDPFLQVNIDSDAAINSIHTNLVGEYNLPNVLAAVAVGKHFNVPAEKIKTTIENYQPSNSRSQLMETGTNKIILDAYNANPSSMKAAVENFSKIDASKKILILGAMAELGPESVQEHQQLVHLIQKFKWEKVILVGGDFKQTNHPFIFFPTAADAANWYKEQQLQNSYVLIKGSRSMKMENVLN